MLAQEVKTITSQGIRFLKSDYYNDALYGLKQKVIIKYSLFDLSYINVYTMSGKFLCKADRITLTHPLAHYTSEIKDIEDYKQKIQKQKQLKNRTMRDCKEFLRIKYKTLKPMSYQTYKTFIYAQIIPYFKISHLKDLTVQDIQKFKEFMQQNKVSESRIKNILCLLNQIIKYFQSEGYINKTCIFEVKRVANIPKRKIQVLLPKQLAQLFKITNKKYPYLTPIIQNVITLKQPLNTILIGSEQETKFLKRKIRKDFYKIKQEMGLENYVFNDLRSIENEKLVFYFLCE